MGQQGFSQPTFRGCLAVLNQLIDETLSVHAPPVVGFVPCAERAGSTPNGCGEFKKTVPKWVALVSGNMDQNLRAPPV